ncbi:hypothetical protein B398_03795 [Xylella fastidiosa 32]|uniref:Uncharacterized protein n=1 Tax=Xylella fastidiosa subsp. sandyi Ann-1 TaxID=155920 RepID=A0A060H790_XYLFS|nr:hypothetical protein XFLM_00470 [Xylella fastidiosa subsp. fastidiosa GB514]AIC11190.1 hypothetical protein D934_05930 [Xylella fastidiosa subsp. sandyi Ann-1]ETE33756.1 hypothetical protein B398_03795 [Xylella fastidiosa 32]KAF0570576.1 hypothetical protein P305_02780 [Xylella fastidiosa subsp. fastidiosa Mus-1]
MFGGRAQIQVFVGCLLVAVILGQRAFRPDSAGPWL